VYGENLSIPQYKTTTSAITATCRLVHNEYKSIARKAITKVEFTMTDVNFDQIIDYFRLELDAGFLAILQSNKAKIHVNMLVCKEDRCGIDIKKFYTWALFLIGIKLEAVYDGEDAMWMALHISSDRDLRDECVIENDSSESVRDNIEDIRDIAEALDRTRWRAYPRWSKSYKPLGIANGIEGSHYREVHSVFSLQNTDLYSPVDIRLYDDYRSCRGMLLGSLPETSHQAGAR
jgi:hypothetical protein